jgi:ferric-dicitrate binding protein FerR (iron transport regulator)
VSARARTARCERARAWAALAPDGELADLERRLLAAHLARCAACRSFARHVEAVVAELRAAAPSRPARRFAVPAGHSRRPAYARVRSVAAVAAVAALALGIGVRAPLPTAGGGRPPASVSTTDNGEPGARTVRQLRREALLLSLPYPDRPSRSFGDQPA